MTVPYDIINDIMRVLATIEAGRVPTVACDMCGVSYSTFNTYTKPDGNYPQLAQMREEAEDRLYEQMAEALPHIKDHHIYGESDPKMATIVSSNIKWLLERRRRTTYGAQSTIEHKITADKEVLDALHQAKARAQRLGQAVSQIAGDVIDLKPVAPAEGLSDEAEEAYLRDLASIS